MSKDMSSRNRPKFNTVSRLTPNGGGSAGDRPGSVQKGIETGPPGVSRRALRGFFALGTPASAAAAPAGSGGLPADIDELAMTLVRPSSAAGGAAGEVASVSPAVAGVETEASTRPGTTAGADVEPDAQPAKRGRRRGGRQVHIRADIALANPFTLPPPGPVATRR